MDIHQLNEYIKELKHEPLSLVWEGRTDDLRFKQVSKDQGTWVDATRKTARACKMIACMDRSFVSSYGDLPLNLQEEVSAFLCSRCISCLCLYADSACTYSDNKNEVHVGLAQGQLP